MKEESKRPGGRISREQAAKEHISGPVPQRHRNATGQKIDGETNPNGVGNVPKDNRIAGQKVSW